MGTIRTFNVGDGLIKSTITKSSRALSSIAEAIVSEADVGSYVLALHQSVIPKPAEQNEVVPPNEKDDSGFYNTYLRRDQERVLDQARKLFNINALSCPTSWYNTMYYNRFKLPTLDDAFQKGFAHVFFTRPDCNLNYNDPTVAYADSRPSGISKELQQYGTNGAFMLFLSNKASSFSLSDEYIESDSYGKTWSGWKINIGRNIVDSRSAGEFTITYKDDRDLNVYLLHKMWVEYISGVYEGRFSPKTEYVVNRIIDYASSCYYIITAEDGETIIFWSKYYGVFPTTIPSSQFSWSAGNIIDAPSLDVTYKFSFKEDCNTVSLMELNANSSTSGSYAKLYEPNYGMVGSTWVGAPFIDIENGDYKLRFTKKD